MPDVKHVEPSYFDAVVALIRGIRSERDAEWSAAWPIPTDNFLPPPPATPEEMRRRVLTSIDNHAKMMSEQSAELKLLASDALELCAAYHAQWGGENLAKKWELPDELQKLRARLLALGDSEQPQDPWARLGRFLADQARGPGRRWTNVRHPDDSWRVWLSEGEFGNTVGRGTGPTLSDALTAALDKAGAT